MLDIPGIIGGIGDAVTGIGGMITGKLSPELQAKVDMKMMKCNAAIAKAQAMLNTQEAAHRSVFVAGWRPFVGWVCGITLAFNNIARPVIIWITELFGINIELYALPIEQIIPILSGMLGIGILRTYEKQKGIDTKRVK